MKYFDLIFGLASYSRNLKKNITCHATVSLTKSPGYFDGIELRGKKRFQSKLTAMKMGGIKFYYNLGYWFLLFIPLVFFGFYPTYFAIILRPMPSIVHVHFTLMTIWVLMVIVQPFLIKFKKIKWHRRVGKLSYAIAPLVIISVYLMMRKKYYTEISSFRELVSNGRQHYSNNQIMQQVSADISITAVYLLWFILFYSMAVINRRKTHAHSRYMLATTLLLLGPTLDRITYNIFGENIFFMPGEALTYLIIDLVLAALLIRDYQSKRSVKVLAICLIVFVTGQVLYFTVPGSDAWARVVSFIMKPSL